MTTDTTGPAALELRDAWGVDPFEGRSGPVHVTIADGAIAAVSWGPPPEENTAAGAAGRRLVVPAFIDLDAALDGASADDDEGETPATLVAAAAHGGYATVRVRGLPPERLAHAAHGLPVRLLPAPERFASVPPAGALVAALLRAAAEARTVTVVADDAALSAGAEASSGIAATILGLRPAPDAAEVGAVQRALEALERATTIALREGSPGAPPRLHVTRVSLAESVRLVREARMAGLPVTADACAHHLALHDGWLGGDTRFAWQAVDTPWTGPLDPARAYLPSFRQRPPLRAPADALGVAAGIEDGTIDAIVSGHEPWRPWQSEVEYGDAPAGGSTIEAAISLVLGAVRAGVLSLDAAIRALTAGPAAVLGEQHRGMLEGQTAFITIVDPGGTWRPGAQTLCSRSLDTPLAGLAVPGRVLLTIARGRAVYRAAESRVADASPAGAPLRCGT